MRSGFIQKGGLLSINTPLGPNDLLLDAMHGWEAISEPFEFSLSMHSTQINLDSSKIVGKPVTITVQSKESNSRYINGLISRFTHTGTNVDFSLFEATVVPTLWLLKLSSNRKIYQSQSIPDIIKSVLVDYSVNFSFKLSQNYPVLDYCVQYDESAFDFISRLMESVGIFYFFTQSKSAHTMVLGDASSNFVACPSMSKVKYFPKTEQLTPLDTVFNFAYESAITIKSSTVNDYDFTKPTTSLQGSATSKTGSGELYEFATHHLKINAANAAAKIRLDAAQVDQKILKGESYTYHFTSGTYFTLSQHFVSSLNTSYVLKKIYHRAKDDAYTNYFEAFALTTPYRPPLLTRKPRVAGCETALVVGPRGEEIWTDSYGRIKVQFPWDRDGKKDDKSSTWIRVSQSLAGKGFGTMFLPRVGQEVVITYLDADPSRPLVTGCVYNGDNTIPSAFPTNQTQSTILSRSSKRGTAGNEMRFEDKKGFEQVFFHAQKDMLTEIENDLTTTIKSGNEIRTLEKGNRTTSIKKGKEIHTVKGTRDLEVDSAETHVNKDSFTHSVSGDYTLKIKGKLTISAEGGIIVKSGASIAINASESISTKSGTSMINQSGTSLTNQAGTTLTNQASIELQNKASVITSKADATQTVQAGALLTLKGALTKVN